MAKNKLTGFIEPKSYKPCLLLATAAGKQFRAILDTGFNGQLLMDWQVAVGLEVEMTGEEIPMYLADGTPCTGETGWLSIAWFGWNRPTPVFVVPPNTSAFGKGEAETLIGTRLMHPNILRIDFLEQEVILSSHR